MSKMPFRHAHYYLLLLFPLTGLAFWPNYLSDLRAAPYAFHVHGVTASLWIVLLALQSWFIQRRQNALHRTLGYSSFVLFPLFIVGGLLVIQSMAEKFVAGVSPFYSLFGPGLALIDLVSTVGILYLFLLALKKRRKVNLHGGYMLATVFFLIAPILSRLMPALPPLAITGPETFHRFGYGVHIANAIAIAILLAMYARHRKFGRPFLMTAGLVVVQSIMFETIAWTAAWREMFAGIAAVPLTAVVSLGLAAGVAVVWLGWTSVPARRQPAATL